MLTCPSRPGRRPYRGPGRAGTRSDPGRDQIRPGPGRVGMGRDGSRRIASDRGRDGAGRHEPGRLSPRRRRSDTSAPKPQRAVSRRCIVGWSRATSVGDVHGDRGATRHVPARGISVRPPRARLPPESRQPGPVASGGALHHGARNRRVEVLVRQLTGTPLGPRTRSERGPRSTSALCRSALCRDQPCVDQPCVDQPCVDQPCVDQPCVDQPMCRSALCRSALCRSALCRSALCRSAGSISRVAQPGRSTGGLVAEGEREVPRAQTPLRARVGDEPRRHRDRGLGGRGADGGAGT